MSRLLGRSVRDLAEEVDVALGKLAQARGLQEVARNALLLADDDVREAEQAVSAARDALFREHPELGVTTSPTVTTTSGGDVHPSPDNPALLPGQDPSKFEMVEVDDADDPRFTAGAGAVAVDPRDDADLPPIVWGEHDG